MSRLARVIAIITAVVLLTACGNDDGGDLAASDDGTTTGDTGDTTDDSGDEGTDDGSGGTDDSTGDATDDSATDDSATDDGSDDSTTEEDGQWSTVYLVREVEGELYVESEERLLDQPTEQVATAAMEQLFEHDSIDPNLFPPAGTDVEVLSVAVEDRILVVNVSDAILDAATGGAGEEALQQSLAHTGTQFSTVDAVELRIDGDPITELWGHLDWSEPATPDPYALAPIDVESPRYGETLESGPLTVAGTSLTFESNVQFALLDAEGDVVEEGFTTANQPDVDQRGPFEFTFETEATPGQWTIRVIEPDPSGGEGPPPYTADILVTVE